MAESLGRAAKAASDEATGKTRPFVWTYEDSDGTEQTIKLDIPKRFKRLKFAKLMSRNDIMGGLELVFGPAAVEELEELDMGQDEFEDFLEKVGEAIGGTTTKN